MENGTELNTTEVDWNPDTVEWTQEITLGEAKLALEKVMYPFKKVSHSVEAGNGQSQGQAEFGGREAEHSLWQVQNFFDSAQCSII